MLCAANCRLSELTHRAYSDICCVKRIGIVNVTAFTVKQIRCLCGYFILVLIGQASWLGFAISLIFSSSGETSWGGTGWDVYRCWLVTWHVSQFPIAASFRDTVLSNCAYYCRRIVFYAYTTYNNLVLLLYIIRLYWSISNFIFKLEKSQIFPSAFLMELCIFQVLF